MLCVYINDITGQKLPLERKFVVFVVTKLNILRFLKNSFPKIVDVFLKKLPRERAKKSFFNFKNFIQGGRHLKILVIAVRSKKSGMEIF